jgi:hypothetical protein
MFLQFREKAIVNYLIKLKLVKAAFTVTGPTLDRKEPNNKLKKRRVR